MENFVNMEKLETEMASAVQSQNTYSDCRQTTSPQKPKYVSIFRIDGVPIMPPVMTNEKRRQMQKIREKAIRIQKRLENRKRQKLNFPNECTTAFEESIENIELFNGDIKDSSSSLYGTPLELETYQEEVDDSFLILSNLIKSHEEENKEISNQFCLEKKQIAVVKSEKDVAASETIPSDVNLMERILKLQRSKTVIYDNSSSIPIPIKETRYQLEEQQANLDSPDEKHIGRKQELRDVEEDANLNYVSMQKPLKFSMEKTLKGIPSICVDPPTPVTTAHNFCDEVSHDAHLNDLVDDTKMTTSNKESIHLAEISSDDSFSCKDSTNNLEKDKVTSKILKFDKYAVESEEKVLASQCNVKPPRRSATSPSLKPLSDSSPDRPIEITQNSQTENGLVRSNSFTLDYPSKALIEHIRQQQAATSNYPTKRSNILSQSATRDTVESKAKKVQKVEFKPRPPPMRLQTKTSSTNIATPPNSYPTSNSLQFKNKRSPYDNKQNAKIKVARQLKKSVSGTSAIKQVKPRPSMPSMQTIKSPYHPERNQTQVERQNINEIESEHRQIFLQLLAQQKAEQRRMQQVFEQQQQQLLEQLSAKMGNIHLQGSPRHKQENESVGNSPAAKSESSDAPMLSPSLSVSSSVISSLRVSSTGVCELPSLELSGYTGASTPSLSSSRCTPRRRLFTLESSPPNNSLGGNAAGGGSSTAVNSLTNSSNTAIRRCSMESFLERAATKEILQQRAAAAASKINAHVRGYLVRRLFQTEHIQRIVQTIRDTLTFVLSLHAETMQNPAEETPENIRLKARLLQQLSSATRSLHLVLFQTTIKERMEIINRDRKRINTKMLRLSVERSSRLMT